MQEQLIKQFLIEVVSVGFDDVAVTVTGEQRHTTSVVAAAFAVDFAAAVVAAA